MFFKALFSSSLQFFSVNQETFKELLELRDRSLILPGEGVEDIWEGDQYSAHSGEGDEK